MAELVPAAAVASVVDGGDAAAAAAADGTLGKRGAEEAGEKPPAGEAPPGAASAGSPKKQKRKDGRQVLDVARQGLVAAGFSAADGAKLPQLTSMLKACIPVEDLNKYLPPAGFRRDGRVLASLSADLVAEAWTAVLRDNDVDVIALNQAALAARDAPAVVAPQPVAAGGQGAEGAHGQAPSAKVGPENKVRTARIYRGSRGKHTEPAQRAVVIDRMDAGAREFSGSFAHVLQLLHELKVDNMRPAASYQKPWHESVEHVLSYLQAQDVLHLTPRLMAESLAHFCPDSAHFCAGSSAAEACGALGHECLGFPQMEAFLLQKVEQRLRSIFDHRAFAVLWDAEFDGLLADIDDKMAFVLAGMAESLELQDGAWPDAWRGLAEEEAQRHLEALAGGHKFFRAREGDAGVSANLFPGGAPHYSAFAQAQQDEIDKENRGAGGGAGAASAAKTVHKRPFTPRQVQAARSAVATMKLETWPRKDWQKSLPEHAAFCLAVGEDSDRAHTLYKIAKTKDRAQVCAAESAADALDGSLEADTVGAVVATPLATMPTSSIPESAVLARAGVPCLGGGEVREGNTMQNVEVENDDDDSWLTCLDL